MLDVFNTPTPQGANYQEFYGGGTTRDWIKPRGASMVRMLLIGAGGGGSSGTANSANGCNPGASAAVTEWIGPAIFIPDVLRVSIGLGGAGGAASTTTTVNPGTAGTATSIVYQAKDGTGYTLLTANGGGAGGTGTTVGTAGAASSNNYFGAAGIFSSIAGQSPTRATNITASSTIFLSAGASGGNASTSTNGFNVAAPYGYPTLSGGASGAATGAPGADGFFITQPIMFGVGGAGGGSSTNTGSVAGKGGNGGIGCGGGGGGRTTASATGGAGGRGGDGAVFIWAW